MRKESFSVLFETKEGMAELVNQPCMWRSAVYFVASMGLFTGVCTNTWLMSQPLEVRAGVVLSTILFLVIGLFLYAMLLHGMAYFLYYNAFSKLKAQEICILGYTALPFLVLTPVALLAGRMGLVGLPLLAIIAVFGFVWMNYLLVRALEVVYIISVWQALGVILFSLILLYVFFTWPFRIGINLLKVIMQSL